MSFGYSRLMATDEVGTYARIVGLYHGVMRRQRYGSGAISASCVATAHSSFSLARPARTEQCSGSNAAHAGAATTGTPTAPRLTLRIAIHTGEVLITDDGVFGDAVNLTARLQEHAPPGGTVLSEAVAQAQRDILHQPLVDLGLLRFKNDERPFRAYALGTAHATPQPRRLSELPA